MIRYVDKDERRARKLFDIMANKAENIKKLIGIFVSQSYGWQLLDFRFVTKLVDGCRTSFNIGGDISQLMGDMYEITETKKIPFDLDAIGADDREWKGVKYHENQGYLTVFRRNEDLQTITK